MGISDSELFIKDNKDLIARIGADAFLYSYEDIRKLGEEDF